MDGKQSRLDELRIDRTAGPDPERPRWLWPAAGGGGVLLVVLLAWLLWPASGVPVKVATARAIASSNGAPAGGSMLDASGYVVARRTATVASKFIGKVVEVLIEEGQRVEQGQVMARLDDTNARAAFDQAQANLGRAQAGLKLAEAALADIKPTYERSQKLVKEDTISQQQLETTRANYNAKLHGAAVARQEVAVATAAVEVAQRQLDDTIVRAPFSGVITVKAAQPGEIVSPSASGGFTRTGIGTIVDMNSLEVEVDVSENFISRVKPGQPAIIKLNAYPDWQIPAEVLAVIPTADRAKATVKVRIAFKERDSRVVPDMGARVSFLAEATKSEGAAPPQPGVIVPTDAVQGSGDVGAVFVIQGSTVERRTVKLGARNPDGQTVLSGLTAGTRVAAGDLSKLSDGAKIKIED